MSEWVLFYFFSLIFFLKLSCLFDTWLSLTLTIISQTISDMDPFFFEIWNQISLYVPQVLKMLTISVKITLSLVFFEALTVGVFLVVCMIVPTEIISFETGLSTLSFQRWFIRGTITMLLCCRNYLKSMYIYVLIPSCTSLWFQVWKLYEQGKETSYNFQFSVTLTIFVEAILGVWLLE